MIEAKRANPRRGPGLFPKQYDAPLGVHAAAVIDSSRIAANSSPPRTRYRGSLTWHQPAAILQRLRILRGEGMRGGGSDTDIAQRGYRTGTGIKRLLDRLEGKKLVRRERPLREPPTGSLIHNKLGLDLLRNSTQPR